MYYMNLGPVCKNQLPCFFFSSGSYRIFIIKVTVVTVEDCKANTVKDCKAKWSKTICGPAPNHETVSGVSIRLDRRIW